MPWRINHEEKALFAEELVIRAAMPAGVRLSFRSNTTSITGSCNAVEERSQIDLVVNGKLAGSEPTDGLTSFSFENLGREMKNIEIWMPQFGEIRLDSLEFDDDAETLEPTAKSAKSGTPTAAPSRTAAPPIHLPKPGQQSLLEHAATTSHVSALEASAISIP